MQTRDYVGWDHLAPGRGEQAWGRWSVPHHSHGRGWWWAGGLNKEQGAWLLSHGRVSPARDLQLPALVSSLIRWQNLDQAVCVFPHLISVQFSCSVVSDFLRPHESQHARPPCPSPTPRVYPTHDHWVGDAILPSHPLSSPSPPAFNLSQHQGLFQWVSSSHQVAKVLEFQLQHQSVQWTPRTDLL